jgi:ectoine hydroxylase-related dioxygenase (phytanoyl-CoA dioxygenase family)
VTLIRKELSALLNRDGAAIVEAALDQQLLSCLNSDFDGVIAATEPGLRHATSDAFVEFHGNQTIRLDGLPAISKTFLEVMQLPLISGVADELLLPNCEDYLLNTGQLIQIGPAETPQEIHRDEDAWSFFKNPKPLLQVEAMFALTDFTMANGATQVVPGSHLWPAEREAKPEEIIQAEMTAGSALFYLGSTLHGGGTNTTSNEWRRGMFFGFVIGWLRTEENMFLTVPVDEVRKMPVRCQELLGYKAHEGIGVVDVGSPMALLS